MNVEYFNKILFKPINQMVKKAKQKVLIFNKILFKPINQLVMKAKQKVLIFNKILFKSINQMVKKAKQKILIGLLMGGSRGGPDPPPLKNYQNIGFLAILIQIPWKITKLSSQLLAFRWWADGGPLLVVFGSSRSSSKKCFQSWTPSGKKFHDLCMLLSYSQFYDQIFC